MKRPTTAVALAAAAASSGSNGVLADRFGHALVHSRETLEPEETIQDLLEEHISPQKLMRITGCEDLTRLKTLVLDHIDASNVSGLDFGAFVPNLTTLRFTNSHLPKIRMLGSSLGHLVSLHLRHCGVKDLDGIASFTALRELDLAENQIVDIVPLSRLDSLVTLDLTGNHIVETDQVEYLALLPHLKVLSIDRNPIELGHPNWVQHMQHLLPSLTSFNGIETPAKAAPSRPTLTPAPPAIDHIQDSVTPRPPPSIQGSPQRHRSTRHSPVRTAAAPPADETPIELTMDQRPVTRQRRTDIVAQDAAVLIAARERSAGLERLPEPKRVFIETPPDVKQSDIAPPEERVYARPPTRGAGPQESVLRRSQTASRRAERSSEDAPTPRSSTPNYELDSTMLNEYRPKLTVVRAIGPSELSDYSRRGGARLARESSPIAPALRTSDEDLSSST